MELYNPVNPCPARKLVAIKNEAAGDAYQREVRPSDRPNPEVNLEQSVIKPKPLGLVHLLVASAQLVFHNPHSIVWQSIF